MNMAHSLNNDPDEVKKAVSHCISVLELMDHDMVEDKLRTRYPYDEFHDDLERAMDFVHDADTVSEVFHAFNIFMDKYELGI